MRPDHHPPPVSPSNGSPPLPLVEVEIANPGFDSSHLLTKPVVQLDLDGLVGAVPLLDQMAGASFQARRLGRAAQILRDRLTDPNMNVIFSLAGSLFSAGLRRPLLQAVEANLVDAIVCTGALLEQDLVLALGGTFWQCDPGSVDDAQMRSFMLDRVWDHLGSEHELQQVDYYIADFADSLGGGSWTSRSFLERLGRQLFEEGRDCLLATAYRQGVPIYVPALSDCAIGIGLVLQRERSGRPLQIDSVADFHDLTRLKAAAGETGLVIVGGGVPKNYSQDCALMAEMLWGGDHRHRFGIQLSVADERDGGLSGSTLSEAISWGKNDPQLESEMVWGEASLTLPLLLGYVYHTVVDRPARKLLRKLSPVQ